MSNNDDLHKAKSTKNDEFYTCSDDIVKELSLYNFENKVVYCNCDNPVDSNFVKYFIQNFNELKLKKVICTHISGRYISYFISVDNEIIEHLVEIDSESGYMNGDFRSKKCIQILEECDIVVTNPPFSLFRDFIALMMNYNKEFIIIGNINAVTYKEIFPLIRDNKVWLGPSISSGDRKFYVPDDYPLEAQGCGIDDDGKRYIRVKGVRWFTNMNSGKRNNMLELGEEYCEGKYNRYDNYDAIDIPKTKLIPNNYDGIMGVPITFLDKYNPDQFEIIGLAAGNSNKSFPELVYKAGHIIVPKDKGGCGVVNGNPVYARVLIRWKK